MYRIFDVLINDLSIVDGTGKPAFKGNIRIKEDKIAEVGNVIGDAARETDG